uniref:Uncharacterized protein n=1 Tax=Trichogramma kaykai TaxID=54128 RepID=A0ABD2VYA4_9HYME
MALYHLSHKYYYLPSYRPKRSTPTDDCHRKRGQSSSCTPSPAPSASFNHILQRTSSSSIYSYRTSYRSYAYVQLGNLIRVYVEIDAQQTHLATYRIDVTTEYGREIASNSIRRARIGEAVPLQVESLTSLHKYIHTSAIIRRISPLVTPRASERAPAQARVYTYTRTLVPSLKNFLELRRSTLLLQAACIYLHCEDCSTNTIRASQTTNSRAFVRARRRSEFVGQCAQTLGVLVA